jgi:hypothetical protein
MMELVSTLFNIQNAATLAWIGGFSGMAAFFMREKKLRYGMIWTSVVWIAYGFSLGEPGWPVMFFHTWNIAINVYMLKGIYKQDRLVKNETRNLMSSPVAENLPQVVEG